MKVKATAISLFLLLVAVVAIVEAQNYRCLNNCSNRGICISGTCLCGVGWAGEDCSFKNEHIENATSHSGTLSYNGWAYYNVRVTTAGGSITWVVNSTRGDCDVYVYRNDYPTRSRWIIRDVSANLNSELTLRAADEGVWVAGIYGFDSCDYRLSVYIYQPCPRSCSNHGICVQGTCLCDSGWSGSDCSLRVAKVLAGNSTTYSPAYLSSGEWDYYALYVNDTNSQLEVEMWDKSGDCDLYINFDHYPTSVNYVDANLTFGNYSSLHYNTIVNHVVYIGIYGFWGCNYTLKTTTAPQTNCEYLCSSHGDCDVYGCKCFTGFSGPRCERKTSPLKLNETLSGTNAGGTLSYFSFSAETASTVTVSLTSWYYSATLYASEGSKDPTLDEFDYSVSTYYTTGLKSHLTLDAYGEYQDWSFAVHSALNTHYNLTITLNNANYTYLPNNSVTSVALGKQVSSTVRRTEWRYFSYNLTQAYYFEVFALELTVSGEDSPVNLTMSVRNGEQPTALLYTATDNGSANNHYLRVAFNQSVTTTMFVGLYSNADVLNYVSDFEIIAWAPSFGPI